MTSYQKGTRLERLARLFLERDGWAVARSAGSKGTADLIAWNWTLIRFIQVKAQGSPPSKAEKERLRGLQCPPNGSVELWTRDGSANSFSIEILVPAGKGQARSSDDQSPSQ